jgi:hypothetical protein
VYVRVPGKGIAMHQCLSGDMTPVKLVSAMC